MDERILLSADYLDSKSSAIDNYFKQSTSINRKNENI